MAQDRRSNGLTIRTMTRKLILTLCLCAFAVFGQPNWTQLTPEILEHYSALLKIDTSSPPGNETLAAKYIQQALERDGIASKLLAQEPSRANLVARIKGSGSKRPLLIMGHTDV